MRKCFSKVWLLAGLLLLWFVACRTKSGVETVMHSFTRTPPPLLFEWEQPIQYLGGTGLSAQDAIIIQGVSTKNVFRGAQSEWLNTHYPVRQKQFVSTTTTPSSIVQRVEFEDTNGETASVYFDITKIIAKPDYGVWFFLSDSGKTSHGELERAGFEDHYTFQEMLYSLIGTNSGSVILQIDDLEFFGALMVGRIENGQMNGLWKYYIMNPEEPRGGYFSEYRDGELIGIQHQDGMWRDRQWLMRGREQSRTANEYD